uniref:RING-type domain-containing protein n=1 Tax=Zonotrichia albicollis TaxID=44394 RepID=A0A8D2MP20_ZONAL
MLLCCSSFFTTLCLFGLHSQMAMEEGFSEGDSSSSTTNNNQELLPMPQRAFICPICLDTIEDETSVSCHAFCFPCILECKQNFVQNSCNIVGKTKMALVQVGCLPSASERGGFEPL